MGAPAADAHIRGGSGRSVFLVLLVGRSTNGGSVGIAITVSACGLGSVPAPTSHATSENAGHGNGKGTHQAQRASRKKAEMGPLQQAGGDEENRGRRIGQAAGRATVVVQCPNVRHIKELSTPT